MKNALNFILNILRFIMFSLALYLAIKQNYLGSICIWLQLIYFKILEKK